MQWVVNFDNDFAREFAELDREVKIELRALVMILSMQGPTLGRPWADTLKGSRFANMKELLFHAAHGVWRVAFALEHARIAVLLVGGDKSGGSERRFYTRLIRIADERYETHLKAIETKEPN